MEDSATEASPNPAAPRVPGRAALAAGGARCCVNPEAGTTPPRGAVVAAAEAVSKPPNAVSRRALMSAPACSADANPAAFTVAPGVDKGVMDEGVANKGGVDNGGADKGVAISDVACEIAPGNSRSGAGSAKGARTRSGTCEDGRSSLDAS